ncbi:hypothetical protein F9K79_19725 [Ochrobactrum sp. Kaboul]|nr:hypothetical protein F9K79_19725 [Ochrobactrum sp. Kaboul]
MRLATQVDPSLKHRWDTTIGDKNQGHRESTFRTMAKTFKVGRDSGSGQFIKVSEAERRPNTTTVERVPKPGYGDTKK